MNNPEPHFATTLRKGAQTRQMIIDAAIQLARQDGLRALTLGQLADRLQLSKSGLFGHFGSKEALQLAVVQAVQQCFIERVLQPALSLPRGAPRLQAVAANWLAWAAQPEADGGCPLLAAALEFDDQPGPIRDQVAEGHRQWRASLQVLVSQTMDVQQLPADTDPVQFAFEWFGLMLAVHHDVRLFHDESAPARAQRALQRLLAQPPRQQSTEIKVKEA
jgi:AcrR family transcriptional regulator